MKDSNLPPQNHSIRNIRTLKLVKAQDTRRLRNIRRNKRQRIKIIAKLHLNHVHPLMYILHEIMKMDASLRLDIRRQRIEKQIHQHGLAASHITIHIQTLRQALGRRRSSRFGGSGAEQGPEEGLFRLGVERFHAGVNDGGGVVVFQCFEEVLEVLDNSWRRGFALVLDQAGRGRAASRLRCCLAYLAGTGHPVVDPPAHVYHTPSWDHPAAHQTLSSRRAPLQTQHPLRR